MTEVARLRRALKASIKTQESMLKTLKELGTKVSGVDAVGLRLLFNYYGKYLEKLKKVLEDE